MSEKSTDVTIAATLRTARGKGDARKMRRSGKIPAVLNHAGKSTAIELDPKLLPKAWTANERKFTLDFNGEQRLVKITELQLDPVKRLALHIDLAYAE